ncbi:MAG: DNA replication terminus site-binding protein, partial [Aeromonas jandaei]
MDTFTPTAALRQQMEAIEASLNQLATLLGQLELQEAHVYPLPPVAQGEEHDPISQIEVGYLSGDEALAATLSAYRDHSARPGCSTKATRRLPGWLRFPTAAAPLIQPLVEEINQRKLDFKALVQQAGGRDEKFELVHTALPGVITLQVYRKLTWLHGEL